MTEALSVRQRAWVSPGKIPAAAKPWKPESEPVFVLHATPTAGGGWVACLREVVAGGVISEFLSGAGSLDTIREYADRNRAATEPGMTPDIIVLPPEKFGRMIVTLGYRNGWPLVGADLLGTFATIALSAEPGRAPRQDPEGKTRRRRHEFIITLPGCAAPSRRHPGTRFRTSWWRPQLLIDPRDAGGAFIQWGTPHHESARRFDGRLFRRGRFVDVRVMASALAGGQVESLAGACDVLGITPPTGDGIDRLRAETGTITDLFREGSRLLAGLGVAPWKAFSTGSLAGAVLDHANLTPPLAKLDVPEDLLAGMAASFQGGTTSANLLRQPVPATLVDRTGDFPRAFSALGLQRLLLAERIEVEEIDPEWLTEQVATTEPDLQALGLVFAFIKPDSTTLPVRVEVGSGDYGTVLGPFSYDGNWSVHALDLVTGWLNDQQVPSIIRAWRLVGTSDTPRVRSLRLPTGRTVDLKTEDLGAVLVKDRRRVRDDPTLSETERDRLVGCLKLFANSITFGLLARLDRESFGNLAVVRFTRPDGTTDEHRTRRPERPARWSFLPAAAAVTACSRFLTARLVARVEVRGGATIATAVDSVTILAAREEAKWDIGGTKYVVLSHSDLREMLADDDRYLGITTGPALWKGEAGSLDHDTYAYCAGINKTMLLRPDDAGAFRVVRSCDTALGGHLVDPSDDPDAFLPDGHHAWPVPLLEALVNSLTPTGWNALDLPGWAERPVIRRLRIVSGSQLRRLRHAFPGVMLRPGDHFFRVEGNGSGGRGQTVAFALDVNMNDPSASHWRFRDGSPVHLIGEFDPAAADEVVIRVPDIATYLDRWHCSETHDSLFRVLGKFPLGPVRGVRRPLPVFSSPELVELCGREGALLELNDIDPDADRRDAIAIYGPAIPRKCAWRGCTEIITGGHGTPKRWCPLHREQRSGTARHRSLSVPDKPRQCAWNDCDNFVVTSSRGSPGRWCEVHRHRSGTDKRGNEQARPEPALTSPKARRKGDTQ